MSAPRELPSSLEALVRRVLNATSLAPDELREIERDLRAHFEDGLEAGLSEWELADRFGDAEEAGRRIARSRRGGGAEPVVRLATWRDVVAGVGRELGHAARPLVRAPVFALVVIITLALGVGANTAVFSVLDAVVLEDLPYAEPERLVRVYEAEVEDPGETTYLSAGLSAALYRDAEVFDRFATLDTYRGTGADLTTGERPERVTTLIVSAGYFETLGIAPALGRTFTEDESYGPGENEAGDRPSIAIVSHRLWRERLGGARDVLGGTIDLDGVAHEIVGVMPAGFADPFGSRADVWLPQDLRPGGFNSWGNHYLSGIARLKPGVSVAVAQERVRGLVRAIAATEPDAANYMPLLVPLHDDIIGPTRRPMLWLLVAAAALVLVSACVNLANLVLARGLTREREV
ncbi:MAG: ABC transporter permease, partial [Longimicrobiales bacterium]